jgi:hypothetical protein
MNIQYTTDRSLSREAQQLLHFDMGSIRQVAAAHHSSPPEIWLADPDQYEWHGRVLRDSESSRLLAYSARTRTVYATDGCNSCARHLHADLQTLSDSELEQLAVQNELRFDLLKGLADLARETHSSR